MPTFHDSGQYFCIKTDNILSGDEAFAANTIPIVVPESEVQDIDNEIDWDLAEIKFKRLRSIDSQNP
jgi:N-acylneuraminate cytidylyltransferase